MVMLNDRAASVLGSEGFKGSQALSQIRSQNVFKWSVLILGCQLFGISK